MFNYHNRQSIFRQSDGELWNFFCDARQNFCYTTLTKRAIWSNAIVLHKNASPFFYAEMDPDDVFHLLFQDNEGNIQYTRLDRQSIKTMPVLNSKTPSVYNKQLFIAPFKNSMYFFYVLHHENSFMLAYQLLINGKISGPKVVDYVSGSSLPCAILYDHGQNIYAFYQSYDGKYLQLGYKKFTTTQKHWSDFTPVTKYSGNCEYPHAFIDDNDIIHLCYQRRSPKLFEMVYQQKAPDKNLWTTEEIIHSSVHAFENASILQENGNIIIYWVRQEAIFYNTSPLAGNSWGKPSRLNFPTGHPLQCLSYKSNSPLGRTTADLKGDSSQLTPIIYPGSLSSGLKLAFNTLNNIGDSSQLLTTRDSSPLFAGCREKEIASSSDLKTLLLDTFKQVQGSVDEIREGLSSTKEELSKLTNAYVQLNRELGKYSIRLNMLENGLGQTKRSSSKRSAVNDSVGEIKERSDAREVKKAGEMNTTSNIKENDKLNKLNDKLNDLTDEKELNNIKDATPPVKKIGESLDPDKLKEWQEWKEPKEWQEG